MHRTRQIHPAWALAIFSATFIFIGTRDVRPVLIFLSSLWIGTLWAKWIEKKY